MNLPYILDSSRPKLAAGCRWGGTEESPVVLFPEGAIRVRGTGRKILELCDGTRSFSELVGRLQQLYTNASPSQIREDAALFLQQLHEKRILDY